MLKFRRLLSGARGVSVALFFSAICPVIAAGTQVLHGHVPAAVARFNLQPKGQLPAATSLHLAIGLPLRNEAALDKLLQQIYDPTSPNYHQYLTPEQFAAQFGPRQQDYQTVIDFAKANGLTVTGTHPNRVVLDVSGSVADIERVFHVTLHTYRHPEEPRDFYAPDVEPSVDLAVPILQVGGLNNYSLPHPSLKVTAIAPATGATPNLGSGPGNTYMGNDFRAAYVPGVSLNGSGQNVALVQFDGYVSNDIAAYLSKAGLTNYPISLTNVPVNGGVSVPGGGNGEVCLDIEMVIAMAPAVSKIIVYEAPNGSTTWSTMLSRIADDNLAKQVSSSWSGGSSDAAADGIFKQMAAQGQSFFCASGDYDAFNGSIPFLLDDTNITLVGGTVLTTTGPGGSYVSETVWNDRTANPNGGDWGSSGGISPTYAIPGWQQGISMAANLGSTTMRNVPDVALTAKNVFLIADTNQSENASGTSCAAPLWAGFAALVNQDAANYGKPSIGFINPAIYAIGKGTNYITDFHDITTGDNTWSGSPTLFYATNGYDLCTGWGTPDGINLINAFVPPDTLQVTPPTGFSSSGASGGPFSVAGQNFALTNLGSGTLSWSLINTSAWLSFSITSGTLTSGSGIVVTASLNTAASNLVAGLYTANVWFTNQTTTAIQNRQFILQVNDPLGITPATSFTVYGPIGGPFAPASQDYLLANATTNFLSWSLGDVPSWLTASTSGGTLTPGGMATVTVSTNASTASLAAGIYVTNLAFTDLTSAVTQSRPVALQIFQSLVQNGGFEAGSFAGWTQSGNTAYTSVTSGNSQFVHSGTYGAELGPSGSLGYLSQTVPTVAGQDYLLSVWMDSPNLTGTLTPNEFNVSWNGGVIFDQSNIGKIGWTNLQFIVKATGSSTVLQLGFRDDPYYLGLDDISLLPVPLPAFEATTQASNTFNFTWGTMAGLVYQVQYKTNLLQTNWINLGKLLVATNTSLMMSDTNAISSSPQRFYRLQVLY